jgi:stage II sporulation protein D
VKTVVATALTLLMLLFICPMALTGSQAAGESEKKAPAATLPIDRTVSQAPAAEGSDAAVTVRVAQEDGTVQSMSMSDYLWRVVAAEMPASFEPEALKAQAVTARTYTRYKMTVSSSNHLDADVCTDSACCQAYLTPEDAAANWGDNAAAYTAKIADAVSSTDGQVILYNGAPIQAVFFSSADGRTENAVEVWGASVPYLTSVTSPEGDEVPGYHSTVTVTVSDFIAAIQGKYPQADLSGDPSAWFSNTVPTSSGGVETVDVGGITIPGTVLRNLFSLRSVNFTVAATAQDITFSVTGYGHGVGMSQYGANAMAKAGHTWQEIVNWYYTDVTIGTLPN